MAENPGERLKIVRPTRDDMDNVTRHVGVPESELPPVGQETTWDKPAPDGPPGAERDTTPPHLVPMVELFDQAIFLEALLMDRCVRRAMQIVKKNVFSYMYGTDVTQDGNPTHPVNLAGIAAPLSVELFKAASDNISKSKDEYDKAILESKRILDGSKTSKIITP